MNVESILDSTKPNVIKKEFIIISYFKFTE